MLTERATGSGALSLTVTPSSKAEFDSVRVHLSAAGAAGNLTVAIDANAGSEYDLVLATQDMTLLSDYHYQPTRPVPLSKGDSVVVSWANASGKTYGVEAKFRGVGA